MPTIISYQKHIDAMITRELRLPDGVNHQRLGQEIATVDGTTYVSLPDGATLPADQPAEIAASIQTVTLSEPLREAIKAASPQVRVINAHIICNTSLPNHHYLFAVKLINSFDIHILFAAKCFEHAMRCHTNYTVLNTLSKWRQPIYCIGDLVGCKMQCGGCGVK